MSILSKLFRLNIQQLNKAPNPYSYYLNIISQWETAPALASLWMVVMDLQSVPALMNDPSFRVSFLDSGDFQPWEISQYTVDNLVSKENQSSTENLMGCVFAQEVSVPGETLNAKQENLSWGGFQTPWTLSSRNNYDKLKITFLETNASFCDLVIRPWLVLTSHYGLVARTQNSPKNVKCRFADVIQFAKTSPYKPFTINKLIRYYDIVPVTLDTMTLSRAEEGLRRRSASFIYNGYSVMEAGTLNMLKR